MAYCICANIVQDCADNAQSQGCNAMNKPFPSFSILNPTAITPENTRNELLKRLRQAGKPITVRDMAERSHYLKKTGMVRSYKAMESLYNDGIVDFVYENEGKRGRPRYAFWIKD